MTKTTENRGVIYLNGRAKPKDLLPGYVLVHNHVHHGRRTTAGMNGFRYWLARPSSDYGPCGCRWREDLGEHYCVKGHEPIGAAPLRVSNRKGNLENINGFLDFRLCHDIDRSVRVTAMCPHSNQPPKPHSWTMPRAGTDS